MGEPVDGMGKLVRTISVVKFHLRLSSYHQLGRSADYNQGISLKFKTKEDAIHFSEKQGPSVVLYNFIGPCTSPETFMALASCFRRRFRLGLLRSTGDGETNPTEKLQRELSLCAREDTTSSYQVIKSLSPRLHRNRKSIFLHAQPWRDQSACPDIAHEMVDGR